MSVLRELRGGGVGRSSVAIGIVGLALCWCSTTALRSVAQDGLATEPAPQEQRREASRDPVSESNSAAPDDVRGEAADSSAGSAAGAGLESPEGAEASAPASYVRWQYSAELALDSAASPPLDTASGEASSAGWWDFVLTPDVFDGARVDLGDLRLVDGRGRSVPYALRIRHDNFRDERVAASQFNESTAADGAVEYWYDLGESPPEHNQVEVDSSGLTFRRAAVVEGSDDQKTWRTLARQNLLRFPAPDELQKRLDSRLLSYSPSRYRYLRLRVERDPVEDREPFEVSSVHVIRHVAVPGEYVSQVLEIGPREPTRADGAPASAWILSFPKAQQPCSKLLVRWNDVEFARDYRIETAGPVDASEPFAWAATGSWSRREGEERRVFEAPMADVVASRLRLTVIDHSNPPLTPASVQAVAPVRQIVFAKRADLVGPLTLYFGNPRAEPPQYDLERNLPARLAPEPTRLSLGQRVENPQYEPEPPALSERLPWLIYLVLGGAGLAVAAILVDVARRSIARHDARSAAVEAA